jgi:sporulation protein YlmC with PRC-barrel domain
MSRQSVSVGIRAERRNGARRRSTDPPSGAQRLLAEVNGQAGTEPGDPEPRWLVELAVDLRGTNLDPEYWLSHCEGFFVDDEAGKEIGVVDEVQLEHGSGRAIALVVAHGWFGRRVQTIPVAEVRAIVPSEERLVVADRKDPAGDEPRLD